MRKLFYIFLLAPALTYSQTWVSVGGGISAGGYVQTLFVYDSVMYAGGYFSTPGNNIIQWNDTAWENVGSGINGKVCAIGLYDDTVYMGGYFSRAGGHSAGCIAKWDGTAFSNAGFDVEGGIGQVNAIQEYNKLLYVGGSFDSVNHNLNYWGLISWNGSKIDSVGGSHYWSNVSILTTYNNLLLFGFGPAGGGYDPLTTWNGKTFIFIGDDYFHFPSSSTYTNLNAISQHDSNLYVGGSFTTYSSYSKGGNNPVNNIAAWNGHGWNKLGNGIHGIVYALTYYNGLLIAAGSFDSAGDVPVNNIAAWNGLSWSALGIGLNGTVYALAVFDSNLYAGGNFSAPAGIAKFNPTLKIPPATLNNDSINIFPNPNNGQFTVVYNRAIPPGNLPILEIYNNLGQKIYSANLADGNNLIDIGKQAKGVYIYKVTSSGNNLINPGKFVIK